MSFGATLTLSSILGMLEIEGPAFDLDIDEMDGASLLPSTDRVPLGSALELGLTLIPSITLGAY